MVLGNTPLLVNCLPLCLPDCFFFFAQDDQTALHISSRLGKVDIVQQLLQRGASANAATTSGYTPLHLASREGHHDVASLLLEQGASLTATTKVRCISATWLARQPACHLANQSLSPETSPASSWDVAVCQLRS